MYTRQVASEKLKAILKANIKEDDTSLENNYDAFIFKSSKRDFEDRIQKHEYFIMHESGEGGYPKASMKLMIIAGNALNYDELNSILDSLAREKIINSTHETERYRKYAFANHVASIELNQENLKFLKSLFDPSLESEKFYFDLFSKMEVELENFYKKIKEDAVNKEKVLNFFPKINSIKTYDDEEALQKGLAKGECEIALYRHVGNTSDLVATTKEETVKDMLCLYFLLDEKDVAAFQLIFSDNLQVVTTNSNNQKLLKLSFAKENEMEVVVQNQNAKIIIDAIGDSKHPLITQMNINMTAAGEICVRFASEVKAELNDLYSKKITKSFDQLITVTMVDTNFEFGVQERMFIPYIQCKSYYLYADQIAHGIQDRIYEMVGEDIQKMEGFSHLIYMNQAMLLQQMRYSDEGYQQVFTTYDDHEICMAWEFNLQVKEYSSLDRQLLDFYQSKMDRENKFAEGFISIPLPNLVLFLVMEQAFKTSDNALLKILINKALELINKFDLLVPKKYQNFLAPYVAEEQSKQWQDRYDPELQKQIELSRQREKKFNETEERTIEIPSDSESDNEVELETETQKLRIGPSGLFAASAAKEEAQPAQSNEKEQTGKKI